MKKSAKVAVSMDEYMARVPEPARSALEKVRATIRSVVPPEATEGISYQIPTFRYKGLLVAFAAFSKHCSFFPMSSSLVQTHKKELEGFATAKGTIRFTVDKPLPVALLKKLVKARVAQNEAKQRR